MIADFSCVECQFLLAFTIHFGRLKAMVISSSLPIHKFSLKLYEISLDKKNLLVYKSLIRNPATDNH